MSHISEPKNYSKFKQTLRLRLRLYYKIAFYIVQSGGIRDLLETF